MIIKSPYMHLRTCRDPLSILKYTVKDRLFFSREFYNVLTPAAVDVLLTNIALVVCVGVGMGVGVGSRQC